MLITVVTMPIRIPWYAGLFVSGPYLDARDTGCAVLPIDAWQALEQQTGVKQTNQHGRI